MLSELWPSIVSQSINEGKKKKDEGRSFVGFCVMALEVTMDTVNVECGG